jgi:hypothetical protein
MTIWIVEARGQRIVAFLPSGLMIVLIVLISSLLP